MARMTLAQLEETVEFSRLSLKQANFVRAYVRGFIERKTLDATAATKAAYTCRSDESARTHGHHLLSNPKIHAVLDRFFGASARQVFDSAILGAMRNKKLTLAQVGALELFAKTHGLIVARKDAVENPEPPEPEPAPQTAISDPRVPKDALKVWLGKDGAVVGYRSALGEDIKL